MQAEEKIREEKDTTRFIVPAGTFVLNSSVAHRNASELQTKLQRTSSALTEKDRKQSVLRFRAELQVKKKKKEETFKARCRFGMLP